VPYSRKISDIKTLFTNVAQTSHYEVKFGGLSSELLFYLSQRGVDARFIYEDLGLLCSSTTLPTFSFASGEVYNHIGVQEKFAHSKIYAPINMEFYVDKKYKVIKFLEHWMEFMSSGSHNPIDGISGPINQGHDAYFVRMQYPSYYKSNFTTITKFERDYRRELNYNFIGLFPISVSSIPVSYSSSNVMTVSASFQYERYVCGKISSLPIYQNTDNNKQSSTPKQSSTVDSSKRLIPRSPGSIPSNGVELFPSDLTLYESLYGKRQ